ncbi:hypothetical protein A1Q1_01495 [Trichosporon asahii var. asahii CBS 2479]|uniref:Uncharacterized protein n=1 Tax=Trichosporon asahii var. asahii (strain ATCC 90039 / CBS 2479 / JCM 2466 / KCTC 7840 / NBRC 103889/ NCYC 2677 / UAMH 7654) TaxID=1186058 RepID=J4UDX6_TRIAS|nr:hypothetical protein A1Q1_01495 [Trichosporon asahii var. asahii CBS 2479]EJT49400.1 hypothetical protein A1Q1_01495 [Trichosporon asahii var. asahii CBS 2479]
MSATTTTSAAPPAPAATVAASANANGNTTKRVAVITGAGQGIGAGIAVRLAKDGLDLVLSDLPSNRENLDKVAEECRANGAKVVVKDCDVADEAQVKALVEATKELGGIDGESPLSCSMVGSAESPLRDGGERTAISPVPCSSDSPPSSSVVSGFPATTGPGQPAT